MSWLSAIIAGLLEWIFGTKQKSGDQVIAEQDNKALKDISDADKIKDSVDSKPNDDINLLLDPSKRK